MNASAPKPGQVGEASLTGTILADRYRVLERLGRGGMGSVYLAEHMTIGKKLAVKVLSPKFMSRPDLVERFLREARATSLISQQNVIEIMDFGDTPDGSVFFVMEHLVGEDLRILLRREGRLPWSRVRHIVIQICRALEAAHAAGVIHRDMKPDNCFRVSRGGDEDFIKVLDFGIAKVQDGGEKLTKTGMIFGTAKYMAPEQAQGNSSDPRVDVYAVGIIMYELLCGRVPFRGKDFATVLTQHLFDKPEPPSRWAPEAGIPPAVEAVVLKALLKDPALRFATMTEMIAALEALGTPAGAAVAVAHESLSRPDMSASMTFKDSAVASGTSLSAMSGASLPVEAGPTSAARGVDRRLLGLGIGGLVLAGGLAVAGVFVAGGSADEPGADEGEGASPAARASDDEPAAKTAPATASPTPASASAEPSPALADPSRATLHFETNVRAAILDAADRGRYGFTDDEAGIEFELGEEPIELLLVAEGYEELEIEVIPNREAKHFSFELDAVSKRKRKRKPKPTSEDPDSFRESEMKNPFD